MKYENFSMQELNKYLLSIIDAQTDARRKLKQLNSLADEMLSGLSSDNRHTSDIQRGWTGKAVGAYILQTQEENGTFRRRYDKVFLEEWQRLREDLRKLEEEKNQIRYVIRSCREARRK